MSRSLFLAQTTRHLFLQAGIALRDGGDNHLMILEQASAGLAETLRHSIEAWGDSPFRRVELAHVERPDFGRGWRRSARRRRWLRELRRDTIRRIEAALDEGPFDRIFAGYESHDSQYAMQAAKARRASCVGAYVEDGTAAYAQTFKQHSFKAGERIKNRLRKRRFGEWWDPVEVSGTSRWIDECHLMFPDLCQPALKSKRLVQLDPDVHLSDAYRRFARCAATAAGLDADRLRCADALLVLPRSWLLDYLPDFDVKMRGLVQRLLDEGAHVVLKYHPREMNPDYLGLGDHERLYVAPGPIPFELMLLQLERSDVTVVGDVSSALMSTRWLFPEMRLIALQHCQPSDPAYGYLADEFRTLGIELVTDATALACQVAAG